MLMLNIHICLKFGGILTSTNGISHHKQVKRQSSILLLLRWLTKMMRISVGQSDSARTGAVQHWQMDKWVVRCL